MKKLIDADELYSTLEEVRQDYLEEDTYSSNFAAEVIKAVQDEYLSNAPTIEAEPVRHGRWIPVGYDGYADGCPVYNEWECSECHFACEGEGEPPLNYCPNCGAKMDGGEKKNE